MSSTTVWRTSAIVCALLALLVLVMVATSGQLSGLPFVVVFGALALAFNVHAKRRTPFSGGLSRKP